MKRGLLVLCAGSLALTAAPASAADIPMRAPIIAPVVVPVYSWTGFYIGGNVGGAWQKLRNSLSITQDPTNAYFFTPAIPGVEASGSSVLDKSGLTGGVQAGYNVQSGIWVWGLEADFNWLKLSSSYGGVFNYTTNGLPYTLTVSQSTEWLFTARPRIGLAADRFLVYATGGLALTQQKFNQLFSEGAFTPVPETVSVSRTLVGWTVGAGVEGAIGDGWSVKAEYLFARFGGASAVGVLAGGNGASIGPGFVDGATFTNSLSHLDLHVARVGLNYRFGASPGVARY